MTTTKTAPTAAGRLAAQDWAIRLLAKSGPMGRKRLAQEVFGHVVHAMWEAMGKPRRAEAQPNVNSAWVIAGQEVGVLLTGKLIWCHAAGSPRSTVGLTERGWRESLVIGE